MSDDQATSNDEKGGSLVTGRPSNLYAGVCKVRRAGVTGQDFCSSSFLNQLLRHPDSDTCTPTKRNTCTVVADTQESGWRCRTSFYKL
ncbi:GD15549 [Drosophila simulans]|uniref:GD15549 n=1 Tax=Drosophila simulans TaxID=7240 RepID=B4NVT1_DROSI|nr:GD15549 [Drosophila simulans]